VVIEIKSNPEAAAEREPFFTLDGVEYTIPKVIGAELALQALERFRTEPELAVIAWMMEAVIGKDAWKALRNAKGLDPKDLAAVIEAVRERTMAPLDDAGKS
jgi:hypothetical protein